jgi:hypothetical protein
MSYCLSKHRLIGIFWLGIKELKFLFAFKANDLMVCGRKPSCARSLKRKM